MFATTFSDNLPLSHSLQQRSYKKFTYLGWGLGELMQLLDSLHHAPGANTDYAIVQFFDRSPLTFSLPQMLPKLYVVVPFIEHWDIFHWRVLYITDI